MATAWEIISQVIGWIYFLAWTISFYPQLILNFRRKSVSGLSLDFLWLNLWGFSFYTVYNAAFYWNPVIQAQYRAQHNGNNNTVAPNDVFFPLHAVAITLLTILQTFIYKRAPGQRVSWIAYTYIAVTAIGFLVYVGLAATEKVEWINVLYYMSYVKLVVSFLKYCPQLYLNFVRRSTVGWSIVNILLDFTGGLLSILQLVIDCAVSGDWSGIQGNPAKLGLGLLSIFFDILFLLQHYVFYRGRRDPDLEARKGDESLEKGIETVENVKL
ncbi:uncharacterized protein VTP21DRAFT_4038 [Calcarisporiella thermophila]|uniref:uncharacterized protein n=1 Tax=Calcarisporiella thermophila TaxID=911321 RepID=UPI003742AA41